MNANPGRSIVGEAGVILAVAGVALLALVAVVLIGSPQVMAGSGPHDACNGGVVGLAPDAGGDIVTYDAGDEIVTGVCIKSGANMFGGDHSALLTDGFYEDCYTVSGVGTSVVTVERTGSPGPDCQAISHVDVMVGPPSPEPTPTGTPPSETTPQATPGVTPVASPAVAQPTPTAAGEEAGPSALPESGGPPADGQVNVLLPLALSAGLLLLAGVSVFLARRRPASTR